jgi:hypothetical protein
MNLWEIQNGTHACMHARRLERIPERPQNKSVDKEEEFLESVRSGSPLIEVE